MAEMNSRVSGVSGNAYGFYPSENKSVYLDAVGFTYAQNYPPSFSVISGGRILIRGVGSEAFVSTDSGRVGVHGDWGGSARVVRSFEYSEEPWKSYFPRKFSRVNGYNVGNLANLSNRVLGFSSNRRGDYVIQFMDKAERPTPSASVLLSYCQESGSFKSVKPYANVWLGSGMGRVDAEQGHAYQIQIVQSDNSCDVMAVESRLNIAKDEVLGRLMSVWVGDGEFVEVASSREVSKVTWSAMRLAARSENERSYAIALKVTDKASDAMRLEDWVYRDGETRLAQRQSIIIESGLQFVPIEQDRVPGGLSAMVTYAGKACLSEVSHECDKWVPSELREQIRYLDGGAVAWQEGESVSALWCPQGKVAYRIDGVELAELDVLLADNAYYSAPDEEDSRLKRPVWTPIAYPAGRVSEQAAQCQAFQEHAECPDQVELRVECQPTWTLSEKVLAYAKTRVLHRLAQDKQLRVLSSRASDRACQPLQAEPYSPLARALLGDDPEFNDEHLAGLALGGVPDDASDGYPSTEAELREWSTAMHNRVPSSEKVNSYFGDTFGDQLKELRRQGCFGVPVAAVRLKCGTSEARSPGLRPTS